jgi:hypothetical protein
MSAATKTSDERAGCWAVVIGVGLYVIMASAIATFVGWFS